MASVYEQLKAAGCELDNHYSDLYVKATPESQKILTEHKARASVFTSQIDNALWFEVPFAWEPFWDAVRAKLPLPTGRC